MAIPTPVLATSDERSMFTSDVFGVLCAYASRRLTRLELVFPDGVMYNAGIKRSGMHVQYVLKAGRAYPTRPREMAATIIRDLNLTEFFDGLRGLATEFEFIDTAENKMVDLPGLGFVWESSIVKAPSEQRRGICLSGNLPIRRSQAEPV